MALLEIRNLSVSVDGSAILEDVNLSIGKGETHVLMGPNGAGNPRSEMPSWEILSEPA